MAQAEGYKNIFKSTFLFGFVQVFNIAVKVVLNKIAAILLGPSGVCCRPDAVSGYHKVP